MPNALAVITAVGLLLLALAAFGTLLLLYAQTRVARRAAAGPLLYALQKEYQSHGGALEALKRPGELDPAHAAEVERLLELFARLEQLIAVGALERPVVARAFGEGIQAVCEDERVRDRLLADGKGRFADATALHRSLD